MRMSPVCTLPVQLYRNLGIDLWQQYKEEYHTYLWNFQNAPNHRNYLAERLRRR